MGGFVPAITSAIAPLSGVVGSGGLGGGLLGSVFSTVAKAAFSSAPDAPSAAPAPQAPAAAVAPEAPPVVSDAPEAAQAAVVDTEAARVRALKRRQEAEGRRLFTLDDEDDESSVLTKNLLGE